MSWLVENLRRVVLQRVGLENQESQVQDELSQVLSAGSSIDQIHSRKFQDCFLHSRDIRGVEFDQLICSALSRSSFLVIRI